jgi:hypothetical protein
MDEMQEGITGSVRALAAWRKESQADLGALLGLSPVTVAHRLNGRLAWSLKDVRTLVAHYGITVDQLMGGPASWLGLPAGSNQEGEGTVDSTAVNSSYHPFDRLPLAA